MYNCTKITNTQKYGKKQRGGNPAHDYTTSSGAAQQTY